MGEVWSFLNTISEMPAEGVSSRATPVALQGLGIIDVTGDDAVPFLHNQLTQSVADLAPSQSTLAAWCNAKGRVLALVRLYRLDDGLRLLLPRALVAGVIKRLRLFVLRAKVTVTERSGEIAVIGVLGAGDWLSLPSQPGEIATEDAITAIRLPGPGQRGLLVAPAAALNRTWQAVGGGSQPGDANAWQLLDIRAGLPQIEAASQERHIPQMLNLDALGALSYRKGCYPGQEVVARLYFRGGLKRRLYRVAGAGQAPVPGQRIFSSDHAEAGEVITAADTGSGGFEALAVLRTQFAGQAALFIGAIPLELLELPYALPGDSGTEPHH